MSTDFSSWIDQPAEIIIQMWRTTGLLRVGGFTQEQFVQMGEKLSRSCLEMAQQEDLQDTIFKSFPFYTHKLSSRHACQRFVILDRAMDNEQFRQALLTKVTPELEAIALDQFMSTDRSRKLIPLPNLAAWMTRLSFEDMDPQAAFCSDSVDDWLALLPDDDLTQEAARQQLADLRRQVLSKLSAKGEPVCHKPKI